MLFSQLGLNDRLLQGIRATGFSKPTPIQIQTIPVALKGHDVIGLAQTGTGKTAAFVLPMLHRFDELPKSRGIIRGLILTPTRELAQQVEESITTVGRFTNYASLSVYGGVSMENQLRRLRRGVDIVVATPGRLLDHLQRRSINLSHVEVLVLDEADRMFDMGFINDVRKIISHIPKERQTFLFSATMPESIQKLTAAIQKNPKIVRIGIQTNPAESITQYFFKIPQEQKLDLLAHMMTAESMKSVLVFSRTRRGADKIYKRLVHRGFTATAIHSDRTQSQRQNALAAFKHGRYRVLVATDIAARGIDVEGISHVINYDTPVYAEDYIHRIGRTGRADLTGDAVTFVSAQERKYFNNIEKLIGKRFSLHVYPGFNPSLDVEKPIGQAKKIPARRNKRTESGGISSSHHSKDRKRTAPRKSASKAPTKLSGTKIVSESPKRNPLRGKSNRRKNIRGEYTSPVQTGEKQKYDWKALIEAGEKMINRVRGKF
jgi:ATP-dependent RNA helicase RhlE